MRISDDDVAKANEILAEQGVMLVFTAAHSEAQAEIERLRGHKEKLREALELMEEIAVTAHNNAIEAELEAAIGEDKLYEAISAIRALLR